MSHGIAVYVRHGPVYHAINDAKRCSQYLRSDRLNTMHNSHLPSPRRLRICLINPRFHPSIWTRDEVLAILPGGKRSWIVTGSLPALAALAPEHCDVVLVDENVEDIDFEHLGDFDIVGVTGMIVQRD